MTQSSLGLQIVVTSGQAEQPSVGLQNGTTVETFSVGREGSWQISAEGVASEHLFLYFDGERLFAATTNESISAWLGNVSLTTDWLEVPVGERLTFGDAELSLQPVAPPPRAERRPKKPPPIAPSVDDEKTVMKPVAQAAQQMGVPMPARSSASQHKKLKLRSSARKNAPPDDEATLFNPMPSAPGTATQQPAFKAPPGVATAPPQQPPPPAPKGPPTPEWFGGAVVAPSKQPPLGAPPPAQPVTQPETEEDESSGLKAKVVKAWKDSSVPQKLLLALMPFAMGAMFVIFSDEPPTESTAAPPAASSATVASSSSAHHANHDAPSASQAASAAPANSAAASTEDTAAKHPDAGGNVDKQRPYRPRSSSKDEVTLQRRAADAVSQGKTDEAITLYDELTNKYPDKPAYREAAKILRQRKKATSNQHQ